MHADVYNSPYSGEPYDAELAQNLETEVALLRQGIKVRDDEIVRLTKIVLELRGAKSVAGS